MLGLSDAAEIAEINVLRLEHPQIEAAILAFEKSLEKQALNAPTQPVPEMKQVLMARLKTEFAQIDPAIAEGNKDKQTSLAPVVPISQSSTSSIFKYLSIAAMVLLIASAGLNFYFYQEFQSANNRYSALLIQKNSLEANMNGVQTKMLDMYQSMQMMGDPAMVKVMLPGIKGKEQNMATVYWDSRSKDVYLLPNKLPQLQSNKQYQLWAMVDGKPVDAGMISDCAGLCKLKNIPRAEAFAITLESMGGSPAPNMDQLLVLGKVG
ncbi:MAG: hypothetical protein CFE25_03235 [Chitinophagaceae bacterium BSSC1]|nr:MAG: hypothetical protein CFE25_03235 [Chitinophagaceae bacterium BSSC1]